MRLFFALAMATASLLVSACGSSDGTAAVEPTASTPTTTSTARVTTTPTPTPTATTTPTATAATPSTTPTPTATASTGGVFYTVEAGDTLFDIALKFDVPFEDIVTVNNITDPAAISVGQQIYIPLDGVLVLPTPTATPTPTPTPAPATSVNGIPVETLLQVDDATLANIRAIFAAGAAKGMNAHAFSKVGDSTIELPHFLGAFDNPDAYDLGDYVYLQPVLDWYSGSFARDSVSVKRGLHSWSMFDPFWADAGVCAPGEGPVECEVNAWKPSLLLIRLGSNDVGVPASFEENMRRLVEFAIERGVVPVLGTKADFHEGSDINNEIIRKLAGEYHVPLWDWQALAATLPNRGINSDDPEGVHLSFFTENDYTLPEALQRGHGAHNLSALIVLDGLWRLLEDGG